MSKFVKNLIVGKDVFSLDLFHYLSHEKDEANKNSLLITQENITNFPKLLNARLMDIRGKDNIKIMQKLCPSLREQEVSGKSLYFKEQAFKEFGGRGKPERLLNIESYYTQEKIDYSLDQIFNWYKDESFLNTLIENQVSTTIKSIAKHEPENLIEQAHWKVTLSDDQVYTCENLYWGNGANSLINLLSDKKLKEEKALIEYKDDLNKALSINLSLEFKTPVTDMKQTLLIPQSYTHDYGHFICEIVNDTAKESVQKMEMAFFIVPTESTEEEITRKIRQFKKNLVKIFEKIEKNSFTEFISVKEQTPTLKLDDSQFSDVRNSLPHLSILGPNALLSDSCFDEIEEFDVELPKSLINFFTRAYINQLYLKKNS